MNNELFRNKTFSTLNEIIIIIIEIIYIHLLGWKMHYMNKTFSSLNEINDMTEDVKNF